MSRSMLPAVLVFIAVPALALADACQSVRTESSSPQHRVHCDLTSEITAEDISFLETRLISPRESWATGGDYSAPEARFYLGVILASGLGPSRDIARGTELLQSDNSSFFFADRPGPAFFSDLGFEGNVGSVDLSELLAEMSDDGTFAPNGAFDRHVQRMVDRGNPAPAYHAILIANARLPEDTQISDRPGIETARQLTRRYPELASRLADWSGNANQDLDALVIASNRGDTNAQIEVGRLIAEGRLEAERPNSVLYVMDAYIGSLDRAADPLAYRQALQTVADVFEDQAARSRFGSRSPFFHYVGELIDMGETRYGLLLFQWSQGEITEYLVQAAELGDLEAQLTLAGLADERPRSEGRETALRWYRLAAAQGSSQASRRVAEIEAELDAEAREAEARAEMMAQLGTLANDPDALEALTAELATDGLIRPMCRNIASQPVAVFTQGVMDWFVADDMCQMRSIFGSVQFAVVDIEPGECSGSGCAVTLEVGCAFQGAPMAEVCVDFYSDGRVYSRSRIVPDANTASGFRLVLP